MDSRPLGYNCTENYPRMIPDFLQDYPYTCEELDDKLPQAFGPWIETTIMVVSNHAHDRKICCSLTGLIPWVSNTPVIWFNRR